jgi:hypothetical protein
MLDSITLEGQEYPLIELSLFRASHGLPADFGLPLFEAKDYTGLGSLEGAGGALLHLREQVLAAIPAGLPLQSCLAQMRAWQGAFQTALEAINPQIGLRPPEVDFAAASFGDACTQMIYALLQAHLQQTPPPSFMAAYSAWLFQTLRLSATLHPYQHRGEAWHVQIISHAYGRAGLKIQTGGGDFYVLDGRLACPAEGFMVKLLREIYERKFCPPGPPSS